MKKFVLTFILCVPLILFAQENTRLLSKLAAERQIPGGTEHRTGVYTLVHEDSSTVPTTQLSSVEFRKKSTANKVAVCTACHGLQGNSPNPDWPNIAGQHPKYFIKQLKDIKEGTQRDVPTMRALVAMLNEQDMDDLAAYYAKMPLAQGSTPEKFLKRGEQIYRGGDFTKRITACIACHGPKGTGNSQAGFPVLSGQHAAYTVLQLNAFKDGKRKNDLNHIMQDISSRMSQYDMEAVAHYIEGLH